MEKNFTSIINKRVTLLFEDKSKRQTFITYDKSTDSFEIDYNNKTYKTHEEFFNDTHYETLVVSDKYIQKLLKNRNFKVRGYQRQKIGINISISPKLHQILKEEANREKSNVSRVIEKRLIESYADVDKEKLGSYLKAIEKIINDSKNKNYSLDEEHLNTP